LTFSSFLHHPHASHPTPLTVRQVASAYNFPTDKATGKGYTAGIIELGGGYSPELVAQYFTASNLPVPTFVDVSVDGGTNSPGDPNGADGEVQLDVICAGAVAPAATYRMYFAGNTDDAFLNALTQATEECNGVSISWGSSENHWDADTMDKFESVIKAAKAKGVPVFVAAGDTGSRDSSDDGNQVDFPASAPSSIACGGTRLELDANGQRVSETVWDDSPSTSATGGGVSKHFPGRTVPDIAGNADPDSGYKIMVDGQWTVVGGTSAVAPLMLGLHALLWELNGGKGFDFIGLVQKPGVCFDVTVGNNGGYRATPGKDEVSGWGVPDGSKLAGLL
jgi:kumamolisin